MSLICHGRGTIFAVGARLYRHSGQTEPKMVVLPDLERNVLQVREHRKRAKPPFAGRYGLNGDTA